MLQMKTMKKIMELPEETFIRIAEVEVEKIIQKNEKNYLQECFYYTLIYSRHSHYSATHVEVLDKKGKCVFECTDAYTADPTRRDIAMEHPSQPVLEMEVEQDEIHDLWNFLHNNGYYEKTRKPYNLTIVNPTVLPKKYRDKLSS